MDLVIRPSDESSSEDEIEVINIRPGVTPGPKWVVNNRALQLTYKTHLPKREYMTWIKRVIIPTYCPNSELIFLELAHETSDILDSYDHTHVVIQITGPTIRSNDPRFLDWKKMPGTPNKSHYISPHIQALQTPTHVLEAKQDLAREDPEHIGLRKNNSEAVRRLKTAPIVKTRGKSMKNSRTLVEILQKPIYTPPVQVADLQRWQLDILEIMNTNSTSGRESTPIVDPGRKNRDSSIPLRRELSTIVNTSNIIHVVHDSNGGSGKITFLNAIKYEQPDQFLILLGLPRPEDLSTVIAEARHCGWAGNCLIFNLHLRSHRALDDSIEVIASAAKIHILHNVWIFTNALPKLSKLPTERWRFYHISGDWSRLIVTFLDPMTHQVAQHKREREEKYLAKYMSLIQDK